MAVNRMGGLFEVCRTITAHEAAQRAGIHIKQFGNRWFAPCPLHVDETPSLCFFPDGGFYCFSCHIGGDAVALYAAILDLRSAQAAVRLAGDFGLADPQAGTYPQPRQPTGKDLKKVVEEWKTKTWSRLCTVKHQAAQVLSEIEDIVPKPDILWESNTFCRALAAIDAAETGLDLLTSATPAQLLHYAGGGLD